MDSIDNAEYINISPPLIKRQNGFIFTNDHNDNINEFNNFFEDNFEEIIYRSIPNIEKDPPSLKKIKSESKKSITINSFNLHPILTKFYSF